MRESFSLYCNLASQGGVSCSSGAERVYTASTIGIVDMAGRDTVDTHQGLLRGSEAIWTHLDSP